CEDGTLCPAETTCFARPNGLWTCVGSDQRGCAADGDRCDYGNPPTHGTCFNHECLPSDGMCGTGVADPNEQCDDGNLISHDGCDRNCGLEVPGWREVLATTPNQRQQTALAYDMERG